MKFKNSIKIRLSLIAIITLAVGLGILFSITDYLESKTIAFENTRGIDEISQSFNSLLEQDEKMLQAVTKTFLENDHYKKIFLEKDRDKLYAAAAPLFEELKNKYGITHLYFHLPEGKVFLRVHSKDIYGDEIKRATFLKAAQTKEISSGVELGRTAFALRVVSPYYYQGKLLGYVEFGEEIDHLLEILKKETGDELIFLGDKMDVNKEEWETISRRNNIEVGWNDVSDHVVLSTTKNINREIYQFLNPEFIKSVEDKRVLASTTFIKKENDYLAGGGFLITGASGVPVGMVVVLRNISDIFFISNQFKENFVFALILIGMVSFAIAALLVSNQILKPISRIKIAAEKIAAGDYNQRIEAGSEDELGALARAFNSMVATVKKTIAEIDLKVLEKTKELETKIAEMEDFQKLAVNRELKMIELKKEMAGLKPGENQDGGVKET